MAICDCIAIANYIVMDHFIHLDCLYWHCLMILAILDGYHLIIWRVRLICKRTLSMLNRDIYLVSYYLNLAILNLIALNTLAHLDLSTVNYLTLNLIYLIPLNLIILTDVVSLITDIN